MKHGKRHLVQLYRENELGRKTFEMCLFMDPNARSDGRRVDSFVIRSRILRGCSSMVERQPFQAAHAGSIPATRSIFNFTCNIGLESSPIFLYR